MVIANLFNFPLATDCLLQSFRMETYWCRCPVDMIYGLALSLRLVGEERFNKTSQPYSLFVNCFYNSFQMPLALIFCHFYDIWSCTIVEQLHSGSQVSKGKKLECFVNPFLIYCNKLDGRAVECCTSTWDIVAKNGQILWGENAKEYQEAGHMNMPWSTCCTLTLGVYLCMFFPFP